MIRGAIFAAGLAATANAADCLCDTARGVAATDCAAATDYKCKSCVDGFFLVGDYCQECSHAAQSTEALLASSITGITDSAVSTGIKAAYTGCAKCTADGCTETKTAGFRLGGKEAEVCETGCTECTEAKKCTATKVADGYYLDTDNKPQDCHTGCDKCTDNAKCSTANDIKVGFKATSATDFTPVECPGNCNKCDTAATGKCDTDGAAPGYFVDSTELPVKCADNCLTCTSTTVCTVAKPGYDVKADDSVQKCSEGCNICEAAAAANKCDTPSATVLSVQDGYRFETDATVKCTTGCATCDAADVCLTAATGYYMDSASTPPNKPKACAAGCAACTSATSCDAGLPGYYHDATAKTSKKCGDNCFTCKSETVCRVPMPTHKLAADASVSACATGCKLCIGNYCVHKTSGGGSGGNDGGTDGSISSGLSQLIGGAMLIFTVTLF